MAYDCGLPTQAVSGNVICHSAALTPSCVYGGNLVSANFILNRLHNDGFLTHVSYEDVDLAWVTDLSGRYILVQGRQDGFIGFTAQEYLKNRCYDLIMESERNMYQKYIDHLLSNNLSFQDLINCRLSKGGEKVFTESSGKPIVSKTGDPLGFCGISRLIIKK